MSQPVGLLVSVEVDPNRIAEFRDIIAWDASESVTKENGGCLRFDVLEQPSEKGNKFWFYEVYENTAALEFHETTPHFEKWNQFRESGGVLDISVERPVPFALGERRIA